MASDFSVALSKMTEDLDLQKVYIAENFEEIKVSTFEVNRPGLELTGYFDFFRQQPTASFWYNRVFVSLSFRLGGSKNGY